MATIIEHRPDEFAGFGPSILVSQSRGRLVRNPLPEDRNDARTLLHDHCPLTPGVYGWLDSNQQICYVGKSKSLRKRLLTYFAKNPADEKAVRIRKNSTDLVWEPLSHELLALIREQELIHRWRPDFNTQGQPTRRQPAFICISKGVAPHAVLSRRFDPNAGAIFGPIAGTSQLRIAIESLNTVFRLRDCPDKTRFEFSDQQLLFSNPLTAKCIRHEIGTCSGPCAGFCSRISYRQQVDDATRFLEGKDKETLKRLQVEMQQAAAVNRFERAATLRDQIDHLSWLDRRLAGIRSAQKNLSGILPLQGRYQHTIWLVLHGGNLIGSSTEPVSADRAFRAIEFFEKTAATRVAIPTSILETHFQLLMISWFRQNPGQKKELISFKAAIDYCHKLKSA